MRWYFEIRFDWICEYLNYYHERRPVIFSVNYILSYVYYFSRIVAQSWTIRSYIMYGNKYSICNVDKRLLNIPQFAFFFLCFCPNQKVQRVIRYSKSEDSQYNGQNDGERRKYNSPHKTAKKLMADEHKLRHFRGASSSCSTSGNRPYSDWQNYSKANK